MADSHEPAQEQHEGGDETAHEHELAIENNPTLPEVEVKTHEEEEETLFKMYPFRAISCVFNNVAVQSFSDTTKMHSNGKSVGQVM